MTLPSDDKIDLLVCDAARQDADGKLSLSGLYPTAEARLDPATSLPVALNFAFVYVLRDGDGRFRATFRITDPLGKELHRFETPEFAKFADRPHIMMLAVERIPISRLGNFTAVLEIDGRAYRRPLRIFQ